MTSYASHSHYIEQRTQDALDFIAIGGRALEDADLISVELGHLHFADVHNAIERGRLYASRDAAVARIGQAIEEAE